MNTVCISYSPARICRPLGDEMVCMPPPQVALPQVADTSLSSAVR